MARNIFWLASYPKSGNTWLRAVLSTLVCGRPADINSMLFIDGHCCDRRRIDDLLGIATADLSFDQETNLRPRAYEIWAADAPRPVYLKVHDACHATPAGEPLFPPAVTGGAVYLVRDPRAVAVSFAHHMGRPIEAAIRRMEDPATAFSDSTTRLSLSLRQKLMCWSAHVESWLAAPFPVHLLRYEDMHADPQTAFGAVAAFLGLPSDAASVAAAIDAARFARLQAQEIASGFVEKPPAAAVFFREGKVDGWRQALTPEQVARIAESHGAVMRRLGYDLSLEPVA